MKWGESGNGWRLERGSEGMGGKVGGGEEKNGEGGVRWGSCG